jgi:mono/diheme cytochrome c family protein
MKPSTPDPARLPFVGLCLTAALALVLPLVSWQTPAMPPRTGETADGPPEPPRIERFAGGKVQRGETLYRQNCASCHRADLKGRCMAPSLLGTTGYMADEAIVAHARKIGATMCCARHIGNLTDVDFADIVAYFHAVDGDAAVRRRAEKAPGGGGCGCAR